MQAARCRLCQVHNFDGFNPFGQVQGQNPDRVKAGNNGFRGSKSRKEKRKYKQKGK